MRLLSIALIAVAIAGAGCGPVKDGSPATSSPDSVPAPSPSTASFPESADGISFERPAEWIRWQPNQHNPVNDGPLIYLSTDRLLPSCATTPDATPNPASAEGRACDWPLAELGPNGVLVTWLTTRILQSLPTGGEPVEVNGATARWQATKPGTCGAIGADETIDVLVPIGQPTPLSNVAVVACLRGPNLASGEAMVRAMLESATVAR